MPMPQLIVTAVLVGGRSKSEIVRQCGVSRRWVITLVQIVSRRGRRGGESLNAAYSVRSFELAISCDRVVDLLYWTSLRTRSSAPAFVQGDNPPQQGNGQRHDSGNNRGGQSVYHVGDHEVCGKGNGRRERH